MKSKKTKKLKRLAKRKRGGSNFTSSEIYPTAYIKDNGLIYSATASNGDLYNFSHKGTDLILG